MASLMRKGFKSQKGMALLLTLMVIVVLVTVIVEYNYNANVNLDIAENYTNKMKASYLAKSGIMFAGYYLSLDDAAELLMSEEEMKNIEPLVHGKPIPLGDGFLTINLEGEEGKINLNKLVDSNETKAAFSNLLTNLDIDYTIYYSLLDWLDADDDVTENGAEDTYYSSLQNAYPCKNGLLDSLDELRLVKGVDEEVFLKLKKYCTIYSNGLININEASKEVLLSLSDKLTEYDVNKIIADREEKEYENINELAYLDDIYNEIKNKITVGSEIYKVNSTGVVNEISYQIVNYIELKDGNFTLLSSKEE